MNDVPTLTESTAVRFGTLARLPLFFALQGKRAVIAGGSAAAAWKVELLAAAGAAVEVFAVDLSKDMRRVCDALSGRVMVHRHDCEPADLRGAALAVADCPDADDAAAFARHARAAAVPVNVIDKPDFSDFSFGAIVNRSPLLIGISTDGAAPVFAQAIRGRLEAILPQGFARWAAAAARWRDAVKASGLSFAGRRKFWRLFAAHAVAHADKAPNLRDYDRLLAGARGAAEAGRGSVTLIGVEPGAPDLLTLREVRALLSADAVMFDDAVPREVLDFSRREAAKLAVGKLNYAEFRNRGEIEEIAADLGKRVVIVALKPRNESECRRLSSAA